MACLFQPFIFLYIACHLIWEKFFNVCWSQLGERLANKWPSKWRGSVSVCKKPFLKTRGLHSLIISMSLLKTYFIWIVFQNYLIATKENYITSTLKIISACRCEKINPFLNGGLIREQYFYIWFDSYVHTYTMIEADIDILLCR